MVGRVETGAIGAGGELEELTIDRPSALEAARDARSLVFSPLLPEGPQHPGPGRGAGVTPGEAETSLCHASV